MIRSPRTDVKSIHSKEVSCYTVTTPKTYVPAAQYREQKLPAARKPWDQQYLPFIVSQALTMRNRAQGAVPFRKAELRKAPRRAFSAAKQEGSSHRTRYWALRQGRCNALATRSRGRVKAHLPPHPARPYKRTGQRDALYTQRPPPIPSALAVRKPYNSCQSPRRSRATCRIARPICLTLSAHPHYPH
ncbi:hypothetical protein NUW54_g14436 [Trametes sanguinea]|uniref:Uncharacterized protein n=1 Tax=Trametes sanguinea TaxID=158606 RepID=A0ACC1MCR9_9APHY|nr:hypothetical protein NUW54_g14436 [Trametes sanguinea]